MLKRFEENEFVIADYNGKPPFSSFLPGICGADGVPLWCCYVNRGQAIASFGSDGREGAIMEFSPAVEAYEDTARKGFRTFYRVGGRLHEPFAPSGAALCAQTMRIAQNRVSLAETGAPCGLDTRVDCFLLPHRGLGALVRRVMVTNASPETLEVELLDGMARVLPFGVRNGEFREMGNLLRSFFQARVAEGGAALFSLRASTENDARVKEITRAHFCCAAMEGRALPLVLDAGVVFGQDTGCGTPKEFAAYGAPAPRRGAANVERGALRAGRRGLFPCAGGEPGHLFRFRRHQRRSGAKPIRAPALLSGLDRWGAGAGRFPHAGADRADGYAHGAAGVGTLSAAMLAG